jgi:hypothetical protein
MIYRVTARLKPETAAELRRRLDDGSIAAQQPVCPRRCCSHSTGGRLPPRVRLLTDDDG